MEVCEEHKTHLNDFMFSVLYGVLEQILIVSFSFLTASFSLLCIGCCSCALKWLDVDFFGGLLLCMK